MIEKFKRERKWKRKQKRARNKSKTIAPTIEKIENKYNKTLEVGKDLFFAIAAVAIGIAVAVAVIAATHDWFSIRSTSIKLTRICIWLRLLQIFPIRTTTNVSTCI